MRDEGPAEIIDAREELMYIQRRRILLICLFLAAFLVSIVLFAILMPRTLSTGAGVGGGPASIQVETTTADISVVTQSLSKSGTVVPASDITVMPDQPGWVRKVSVKPGQQVKDGDTLMLLEPIDSRSAQAADAYQSAMQILALQQAQLTTAQNSVGTSQADVLNARASLAKAKADLATAQSSEKHARIQTEQTTKSLQSQDAQLARYQQMFREGIVSRDEMQGVQDSRNRIADQLDQSNESLQAARSDAVSANDQVNAQRQMLDQAEHRLSVLRNQVQSGQQQIKRQTIMINHLRQQIESSRTRQMVQLKSPTDGVVSDLPVTQGAMVTPAMTVSRIKESGVIYASIRAQGESADKLRAGMPATITLPQRGRVLTGKVNEVSEAGANGVKAVQVLIKDVKELLRPGMKVEVSIPLEKLRGIVVPKTAVVSSGEERTVWVVENGMAQAHKVRVARYIGKIAVISDGLSKGDKIILQARKPLHVGDTVSQTS